MFGPFSRLRRLRRRGGSFRAGEESQRAHELTASWLARWPRTRPAGYLMRDAYPDRWVRFHSLPESKRYAETGSEHDEVLRRHLTVLAHLQPDPSVSLRVIVEDFGSIDFAGGWSRRTVAGRWPWLDSTAFPPDDDDDDDDRLSLTYYWSTDTTVVPLAPLLTAAAADRARFLVGPTDLRWVYAPYDGGADVFLPTTRERDALAERLSEWLSDHPSGL